MSRFGRDLIQSAHEALEIARGTADPNTYRVYVASDFDVRAIRAKTGLSQERFAARIGVPVGTLRGWEQGRRRPEGPARVLLSMLDRNPRVVEETLGADA